MKIMPKLWIFLFAGLILSSCDGAPKITLCVIRTNDLLCQDPENKQTTLSFEEAKGYLATSPADFSKMQTYFIDIEKQLADCKAR